MSRRWGQIATISSDVPPSGHMICMGKWHTRSRWARNGIDAGLTVKVNRIAECSARMCWGTIERTLSTGTFSLSLLVVLLKPLLISLIHVVGECTSKPTIDGFINSLWRLHSRPQPIVVICWMFGHARRHGARQWWWWCWVRNIHRWANPVVMSKPMVIPRW